MVMQRGEIWWADLPTPIGSEPGYRRPVLIIQDDTLTQTLINTVVVVILTSNLRAVNGMGNLLLPARLTGLPKDSVANVAQIATLDKTFLMECVGLIPDSLQEQIDDGLRSVLYL
jgi:mRNA interferase MazF